MSVLKDVLSGLNPEQREAVTHLGGPLLVVAGAGSGKTRVLTTRIAYLVEEYGISPESILAITFTNKAAGEMLSRLKAMLGEKAAGMWVTTFHSACARILRKDAPLIGFERGFTICDEEDSRALVAEILKEVGLDPKNLRPAAVVARISFAKSRGVKPEYFESEGFGPREIAEVFRLYQERLRRINAMDFDDLLLNTVELLASNEAALKRYREKFGYVLVDEYQDTNGPQDQLVYMLGAEHRNVTVVGDDDQSIYAFRGADPTNMERFLERFPETRIVKLTRHYRAHQRILRLANNLIRNNPRIVEKELYSERAEGPLPVIFEADNTEEEANFIAEQIAKVSEECPLKEIAVFYRTNFQSAALERALSERGIPYKVVGARAFYQRRETKDALAYLRAAINPSDDISLMRIINLPRRGLGETAQSRLLNLARQRGEPLLSALLAPEEAGLSGAAQKAARELAELLDRAGRQAKEGENPGVVLEDLLEESGYLEMLRSSPLVEDEARLETLQDLVAMARGFESVEEFLERLSLISAPDDIDDADHVFLMTVHVAKGLEFSCVFLTGLEDGLLPHFRSIEEGSVDEERRLCYVAITRPKERLYLTFARSRESYRGRYEQDPSRFLSEMLEDLTEGEDYENQSERPYYLPTHQGFYKGQRVYHAHFGEGVIVKISPFAGGEYLLEVEFLSHGRKRLLSSAPLKPL